MIGPITSKLIELDPTLTLHNEGEWSNTQSEYIAFNDAGVETEVGEFLYSMVRVLKPERVLETGSHWGIGAAYMGMALKDNGKGKLDTFEYLPEIYKVAADRIARMELSAYVNCILDDVSKLELNMDYDMLFLDTEPQTRFMELVRFYDRLNDGGYIFIHDLHRHMGQQPNEEHGFAWPWGKIPGVMSQWVTGGRLKPFYFPTPRGLTGFYKTSPEDYNWNKGGEI